MSNERLIDVKTIADRLGVSQRSIWRLRDAGKMPAPVTIGRLVRWRESDISAWLADGLPDVRKTGWTPNPPDPVMGACACARKAAPKALGRATVEG